MFSGERLKDLREDKGLQQQELADILKISKQSISRYERGVSTPDDSLKIQICEFFDVSLDYLMCLTREQISYKRDDQLSLRNDFPKSELPKLKTCADWIYKAYLWEHSSKK